MRYHTTLACEERYFRRESNDSKSLITNVGVRADKTCEVGDGIRVIVLRNFVESLARGGPEINVLRQWLNIRRCDI